MNYEHKQIFEYSTGAPPRGKTRWIAANDQAAADAEAATHGWTKSGTGAILNGKRFPHSECYQMGVDVVL